MRNQSIFIDWKMQLEEELFIVGPPAWLYFLSHFEQQAQTGQRVRFVQHLFIQMKILGLGLVMINGGLCIG